MKRMKRSHCTNLVGRYPQLFYWLLFEFYGPGVKIFLKKWNWDDSIITWLAYTTHWLSPTKSRGVSWQYLHLSSTIITIVINHHRHHNLYLMRTGNIPIIIIWYITQLYQVRLAWRASSNWVVCRLRTGGFLFHHLQNISPCLSHTDHKHWSYW